MRPHDQANRLNMRSHEQRVAHRQDWRAVDHDAVEKAGCFADQFTERWPAKELRGIGGPLPAGKDGKLATWGGQYFTLFRHSIACGIDLGRRNWPDRGAELDAAN